jgi:hypothetical protein
MTEAELQAEIRGALEAVGFWVERMQSGKAKVRGGYARLATKGTPDLLLVAPVYGWLEVKRPGEALNDNQIKWHARAKQAGVKVWTVDTVDEAVRVAMAWRDGESGERAA